MFSPVESRRLYRQVADQIRSMIAGGELVVGQKLPAERDLAEQLSVSRPTVREALIVLEVEGLVNIRMGSGIYVVRVHGLAASPLPAVASLGVRPTVENHGQVLLEAHLLDVAGLDAYGKLVRIEFLQQLRDEEKFPDLPTLTAAIAEDARNARAYFAVHGL